MNSSKHLIALFLTIAVISAMVYSMYSSKGAAPPQEEGIEHSLVSPSEGAPLSRAGKIALCRTSVKETEPSYYHFPCIGDCFCEKKVDGVKGNILKKCGGTEAVAFALTEPGMLKSPEAIDCICDGFSRGERFTKTLGGCIDFANR
jgi:hypothetical protein